MLTVVTGPCGSGKTTWILQELAQMPTPWIFCNAGFCPCHLALLLLWLAARSGLSMPRQTKGAAGKMGAMSFPKILKNLDQ
jgi:hypothetical protein